MLRIVFITLITIGGVIAYAILAPILTAYSCATISIGVGSIVATITSERVILPTVFAPMLTTYTIPIIIDGVYLLAVFAYLDTIRAYYCAIVGSEGILWIQLITTPLTTDRWIII